MEPTEAQRIGMGLVAGVDNRAVVERVHGGECREKISALRELERNKGRAGLLTAHFPRSGKNLASREERQ